MHFRLFRDIASRFRADVSRGRGAPRGRMWFAAIGIDRYRTWGRLHNAVSDARGALELFLRLGFEQACPPVFDEVATGEALRRLVTDDLAVLEPEDSLVVFFAGHGHTVTRTFSGSTSVKTKKGYIIPVDGELPGGSVNTWVRLDSWLGDVTQLPVKHVLVILDACHSGIALDPVVPVVRWRGAETGWTRSLAELHARRSRRVITSSRDDQLAMDTGPVPGHSLFTGCLVEALTGGLAAATGKSTVTGTEIGSYVQRCVIDFPGSHQSPEFGALELDDRGEMIVPLKEVSLDQRPGDTKPAAASSAVRPDGEASAEPGDGTVPGRQRTGNSAVRRSRYVITAAAILGTGISATAIAALSGLAGEPRAGSPLARDVGRAPAHDAVALEPPAPVRSEPDPSLPDVAAPASAPARAPAGAQARPPAAAPARTTTVAPVRTTTVAPARTRAVAPARTPTRRQAWLDAQLFGADNTQGAVERVSFVRTAQGYQVQFKKGIGFLCGVEFDRAGDPSTLVDCTASSSIWTARPARMPLRCDIDASKGQVRCLAPYELQGPNHDSTKAEFVLVRDMNPDETARTAR